MDPYVYVIKQVQKDGIVWTSPEVFTGYLRDVIREIDAGYLSGEARWAETKESGMFLYGVSKTGYASLDGSCPDFSHPLAAR